MRKIVTAAFISLDGVMQAPGAPEEDRTGGFAHGGWTYPYWDESAGQFIGGMFSTPFELLLGRKTYEIFSAYWPYIDDSNPIAKQFNAVTKHVATTTLKDPLTWNKSVALRGDVAAEVARLKQTDGPMLLTQGSSVLLQTLLAHDLIDEFRLLIFPLVLGQGKRLFKDGAKPGALKLASTSVSTTGVIMNVYHPDGAVRTGSFAVEKPSDAELARRERWKREG
jgi:dihydrofolate reductase